MTGYASEPERDTACLRVLRVEDRQTEADLARIEGAGASLGWARAVATATWVHDRITPLEAP